jgi:hypothetical protein
VNLSGSEEEGGIGSRDLHGSRRVERIKGELCVKRAIETGDLFLW